MTLRTMHVTVDCADAARLAGFWAEALDWDVGPDAETERLVGLGARVVAVQTTVEPDRA